MGVTSAPRFRAVRGQGEDSVWVLGRLGVQSLSLGLRLPICKMVRCDQMITKVPSVSNFCVSLALVEKVILSLFS